MRLSKIGVLAFLVLALGSFCACSSGSTVALATDGDTETERDLENQGEEELAAPDGDLSEEDAREAEKDDETAADGDGDAALPDGDADNADGEQEPDAEPDTELATSFSCPSVGFTFKEGVNTVKNNALGSQRSFTLITPKVMAGSRAALPLIFFFHGSGDKMASWISAIDLNSLVNNADFPFIAVVPESLNLMPPGNLAFDWDCLSYDSKTPALNKDVTLFNQLYACVKEALPVDTERVHVLGFSAGAIMTDLLSMAHGETIASVAAFSGAHFSDSTQEECLWSQCAGWKNIDASTHPQPAFLAYGGTSDSYNVGGLLTFHFDVHAKASIDYLNENGHDVVACNHNNGHTITADSLYAAMWFLKDHPRSAVNSPYNSGLPVVYPAICSFHPKTK